MEAQHTVQRQPAYWTLWALWFVATAGYGVVWAAVIVWGGDSEFSFYFPLFGGLWLGILQGLLLRHYFAVRGWWKWTMLSSFGWVFVASVLLLGVVEAAVGSGLSPVQEAPATKCTFMLYGLAGALFGFLQAIGYPRVFNIIVWTTTNAFAWLIGGLLGGAASYVVYGPPDDVAVFGNIGSLEGLFHGGLGLLVAMSVIGAVTGAGAVWQVWMRCRPLGSRSN